MDVTEKSVSVDLDGAALDMLDEHGREDGESREEATARLLEEGLRMAKHPWIFFRTEPAGRRPVLMGGPDVWMVARLFRELPLDSDDAIERAADHAVALLSSVPRHMMLAAIRYYIDYHDEIDEWMRILDEEADRAEAEWLRKRELQRA
jgi:hypothetical protein